MVDKPDEPQRVTNVYEAAKITPLIYFSDGRFLLAALMWLSFVATIFLVLFRQVAMDVTTAAALALFFLIAAAASMMRINKDD